MKQGDDGANAMETDVEDDADTVADTKDARDASSPDGAAPACTACSVVCLRAIAVLLPAGPRALRSQHRQVRPREARHPAVKNLPVLHHHIRLSIYCCAVWQVTRRTCATCQQLTDVANRWRR